MIGFQAPPLARSGFPPPPRRPACDPATRSCPPLEGRPSRYSSWDCQREPARLPPGRPPAIHRALPVLAEECPPLGQMDSLSGPWGSVYRQIIDITMFL